jgi:hypothetical protein
MIWPVSKHNKYLRCIWSRLQNRSDTFVQPPRIRMVQLSCFMSVWSLSYAAMYAKQGRNLCPKSGPRPTNASLQTQHARGHVSYTLCVANRLEPQIPSNHEPWSGHQSWETAMQPSTPTTHTKQGNNHTYNARPTKILSPMFGIRTKLSWVLADKMWLYMNYVETQLQISRYL